VILTRRSSQAAGWNLTFISPAEQLGAHFLPWNGFDRSGVKLSHASRDFFRPGRLHIWLWPRFEGLDEQTG
jgi:hypothetical protein